MSHHVILSAVMFCSPADDVYKYFAGALTSLGTVDAIIWVFVQRSTFNRRVYLDKHRSLADLRTWQSRTSAGETWGWDGLAVCVCQGCILVVLTLAVMRPIMLLHLHMSLLYAHVHVTPDLSAALREEFVRYTIMGIQRAIQMERMEEGMDTCTCSMR